MQTSQDFFAASIYEADMLRIVHAPPPRATLGQRRAGQFSYFGRGAQIAAAVALCTLLNVPPVQAVGETQSVQKIRLATKRNKISPGKLHQERLDHSRLEMRPRRVLAFRPVVRPVIAGPRLFHKEPGE